MPPKKKLGSGLGRPRGRPPGSKNKKTLLAMAQNATPKSRTSQPSSARSSQRSSTLNIPTMKGPAKDSSQSQSLSQSIFGRLNRLDNIFSSQPTAEAEDSRRKLGGSKLFEEDEGFFYKRTKTNAGESKKKQKLISTPILRLNDALDELPNADFDSFDSMDFEPKKKTLTSKVQKDEIRRLSSPIRPRYEGNYRESDGDSLSDEYVEQVSHHKINLTGGDSDYEDLNGSKPSKKDRRISYHNRGKRILSIGNGLVGLPHDDVPFTDYFKLLDTSLPEPHRMKQLLIWCIHKQMAQEKADKKTTADERTIINIAKVIQEEVLQDLREGNISTGWYNKPNEDENNGEITNKEIVLPNPLNTAAKDSIKKFTKQLARLRKEKEQWKDLQRRNATSGDKLLVNFDDIKIDLANKEDRTSLEKYCAKKDYGKDVLDNAKIRQVESIYEDLSSKFLDNIENSIDKLYSLTHQLTKVGQLVDKYKETTLGPKVAEATKNYINKSKLENIDAASTGWPISSKPLPIKQMLRGLTKLEQPK